MAYIYEYIRTQGYEPMHFEEHYTYLDALAITYFASPLKISQQELKTAIKEQLRKDKLLPTTMNVVCIKYFADGTFDIETNYMIYDSFSLRVLHPQAHLYRLSGDILLDNTSAKETLLEFNRTSLHALYSNNDVAIWADEHDEVIAIDGSSVVAVFEDEVRFSRKGRGVEFDLAYDLLSATREGVTKGEIRVEELPKAKELLYINHEGVAAVQLYESDTKPGKCHIYMDILAEKIANKIAEAEQM